MSPPMTMRDQALLGASQSESGVEAIMGGGYTPPNDDFYTYNLDTDSYTTISVYPTTTYGGGGFGNSSGGVFFGGYATSVTQNTKEWNGISWGAGGTLSSTAGNQCLGGGTSDDGMLIGQGHVAYGSNHTYAYTSSVWSSGNTFTYYARQGAQAGTRDGSAMSITGYGGNTGGSGGAGVRAESSTRGAFDGTWSSGSETTHKTFQQNNASGDSSSMSFAGGYSVSDPATPLDTNTNWNGSSYDNDTVMPVGTYTTVGCGSNDVEKLLCIAGTASTGYTDVAYLWDQTSWTTLATYPVACGYGSGGYYTGE